jgi:amino acid efflux transporter
MGPKPLVLLTTGSFVTVYALGTAAALKLLPRGSAARRCAGIALIAVAALCVATGWFLLWPLAMSACALLYLALSKRLQKRRAARLHGLRRKIAQTDT